MRSTGGWRGSGPKPEHVAQSAGLDAHLCVVRKPTWRAQGSKVGLLAEKRAPVVPEFAEVRATSADVGADF